MIKRTFECEVLTPLFLGGADARGAPELRVPSVRGAMRYWYRALLGGSALLDKQNPLQTLRALESELFGSTEQGAALSTRLRQSSVLPVHAYEKDHAIRTPQGGYLPSGKDYLLWSMSSSGKPNTPRFQPARQYIQPGAKFEIILSAMLDESVVSKGEAAFWLLTNLGAVGARANRGAGSLQAHNADSSVPFKQCTSVQALQIHLKNGIQKCMQLVAGGNWKQVSEHDQPEYDILHPQVCEIWVVANENDGWGSYLDALNGLGSRFRDYRTHINPLGKSDHDNVLRWFDRGGRGPELKRPVFGLPIPFRYSEGGPSDVIIHEKSDRRGSPLHMHITRLSDGKYVGVLTLFKSRFLPTNTELQLQERKWKAPAPANYAVIHDFVQTFPVKEQVTP